MRLSKVLVGLALAVVFGAGFVAGYSVAVRRLAATRGYTAQAAVVSGLALAGNAKIAVTMFHSETGRFPSSNAEARLPEAPAITDRYVASVAIGPAGAITITYRGQSPIQGKTLVMTPTVLDSNYAITWSCSGGTLTADARPDFCR